MIDALSKDGMVEDSVLQAAIDEAKAVAKVSKPASHADVAVTVSAGSNEQISCGRAIGVREKRRGRQESDQHDHFGVMPPPL